jgi:uncharacterized protein YaeQ
MALGATIFKAELQIADMDRGYYQDHALVLARHPSETDERLMVRLLAFALNASASLTFGKGLSAEDEPDLCDTDLTGRIRLWIDVGLPADKAIRKAGSRADAVQIYAYGGRSVDVWWKQNAAILQRQRQLSVSEIPFTASQAIAALATRTMRLQCTIQDGLVWLSDDNTAVEIQPVTLKRAGDS